MDTIHNDLAGMILERPFEPGEVFIPSDIRLKGDRLLWTMRKPGFKVARGSVLDRFRRLYKEPDAAILKFVEQFGVAWFCQHRLPGSHAQVPFASQFKMETCFPVKAGEDWFEERIADYRRYSDAADAIVEAAGKLNLNQTPGDEVFARFRYAYRRLLIDLIAFPKFASDPPTRVPARVRLDSARSLIAEEVNVWVAVSQAHPRLDWDSHRRVWRQVMKCSQWGVIGAVALALLTTVPASQGWLLCDICGDSYAPTRPPVEGRNKYCPTCRNSPEMWRRLKRKERERKRGLR